MWLQWLWDGFVTGVMKVVALWWMVPLFIAVQFFKDSGWMTWISQRLRPVLAPLRLPDEAGLPMVAGLAVGLTYGAGVVLHSADEGKLNRNQATVTFVFLGLCHALIEETVLITASGASGFLLISTRLLLALVFGFAASRFLLPPDRGQSNFPVTHVDPARQSSV